MKPDILQLGPQSDRIDNAIARDFTVHRYWEAADKQALLNDLADRLRFIVTTHKYGPDGPCCTDPADPVRIVLS